MKELNLNLSKREIEKKQVEAMKKLGMTDEDIKELMGYDKEIDQGKKGEYELTAEQQKISQEVMRTTGKKKPTVYQLDNKEGKRSKKKNETKAGIIEKLANFLLENVENVEITNAERQIAFTMGENNYELTLVQKRQAKN